MNSKYKLIPKEKREKIKQMIMEKDYGTTVLYEEINEIMQEDLYDFKGRDYFIKQMNKVKNELFSTGYIIRPIYNVGYYILKPNQISSYTYRNYIRKPLKSFEKAKTILENTNKKELKKQEITEYNTTVALNESMIYANNQLLNDDEYKILNSNNLD